MCEVSGAVAELPLTPPPLSLYLSLFMGTRNLHDGTGQSQMQMTVQYGALPSLAAKPLLATIKLEAARHGTVLFPL
jgi:hypothetical protein